MSSFSFKDLGIDLSFPTSMDLGLFKDYVDSIDHSIEALTDSYKDKEFTRYGEYDDPCEVSYIDHVADWYLPNTVKMPLVVSIYTSLEANIEQLLKYAQNREKKELSFKDINGKTSIDRYQKYITHILEMEFKFENSVRSNISDMNKFRNCIAHANGNLQHWPENKVNELKTISEKLNKKESTNLFVGSIDLQVSTEYLNWCLDVTNSAVKPLEDYLKQRYKLNPYQNS